MVTITKVMVTMRKVLALKAQMVSLVKSNAPALARTTKVKQNNTVACVV
jgi:hypothetical protein